MSRARERLFKMLTAFTFDEVDQEYVDWQLFERIESVVRKLHDNETGVKRKYERKFLGLVRHESFTGAEFLHALQRIVGIKEAAEALNLGNMLLHYGYIFAADNHSNQALMKDAGTLYMFQKSPFWPSQKPDGSEEEYAIYLAKKRMLMKGKNGLNQNELIYYEKLFELFGSRWRNVIEKANEQCRILRGKKDTEKAILEKQELSFWRVHRPFENTVDVFDAGFKRFCNRFSRKELRTLSFMQATVGHLQGSLQLSRIPASVAINNLSSYCEQYSKTDVLLGTNKEVAASSQWYKDFEPRITLLTVLRLERWSVSLTDLLSDKKGIEFFAGFLKIEFSEENLNFWLACEELKYCSKSKIQSNAIRIYRDFMAPGARFEINVDNKAISKIRDDIKHPSVYAFEPAQEQIFKLMNTDSYPRFLKSPEYKELLYKAKCDRTSMSRKSNNRILNAARGLVNRSALSEMFSNKHHSKLCRSSSDFQSNEKDEAFLSQTVNSTSFFPFPTLSVQKSHSLNELNIADDPTSPGSPSSPSAINSRMKLKGLAILKLSRSGTPIVSPAISPCPSGPPSQSGSPRVSPLSSPKNLRKRLEVRSNSQKKSLLAIELNENELNERLTKVKSERDTEAADNINEWQWLKVSHDFS